MDFSSYYLMYRHKPRLPIDIRFGLTYPQTEEHSNKKSVARLSTQLQQCQARSLPTINNSMTKT